MAPPLIVREMEDEVIAWVIYMFLISLAPMGGGGGDSN